MKDFVFSNSDNPRSFSIDYRQKLNEEQYRVVTAPGGASLVLAGAGSGKTRTIIYRVAWLLEQGVAPEHILLLTFTNKAAQEMMTRVEEILTFYPRGLWSGTFHSIANRLLRLHGSQTTFGSDFSILDEEDANDLMKMCIKELHIDTKGKRFPSVGVLRSLLSYSENARVPLRHVVQEKTPHFVNIFPEILLVVERYASVKRLGKCVDFDDLLLQLLVLLQTNSLVREALTERFQYILVDEFQDTNVIQSDIVDILGSKHGNILVVGDDAQSIYSFRAAEIRNILDFPQRHAKAVIYRLVNNYRSTPEILQVANAVISYNQEQFPKDLVAVQPSGEKPKIVPTNDAREEAHYVVEQILAFRREGIELKDVAVLFRAAFHSQALEFELMKRHIPYEYRGGMKFFERSHVKDAVAHLRLLRNGRDIVAWSRVLQLQPGLGIATSQKIAEQLSGYSSLREALNLSLRLAVRAAEGFHQAKVTLSAMLGAPLPAEAVRVLAKSESYRRYLEAEYPNFRDRLDDVEQLAVFAEQYHELGDFLDALTLTGDFGGQVRDPEKNTFREDERELLVLSTIHQAKGLEWKVVFVIHCAEGMFPSERSADERHGLEEERRLFYVATTRAREKIFFTYPSTTGYETLQSRQPSCFLQEIPRQLVESMHVRHVLPGWAHDSSRHGEFSTREPVIVLDEFGERMVKKNIPTSFLRDLDDL